METNGFKWVVAGDFAPLLASVLEAKGEVVKESPAKLVLHCRYSGRGYFIKRYRHSAYWLRPLKFWFRESPARREWMLAQVLTARGVPSVTHLALGERSNWMGLQESILVTEAFPGRPVRAENEAEVRSVMGFISGMHDKGVIQHDLHAANVLLNPQNGEVCLVDLYGVEIKDSLSPEERDRNFAALGVNFPLPLDPGVRSLSRALRKKALYHRSKRAWKHNQEFCSLKFEGLRWHVRRPLLNTQVEEVLREPDTFLREQARILKKGRSATVGASGGLVLKRYNFVKPLRALKGLFRRSHAMRCFRLAYHLELVGIRTAKPVASGTARFLGFPTRSFFLMEEIVGARHLTESDSAQESHAAKLGVFLARLHEEGFYHRDLKLTNLVLDTAGQVVLLDLDGLHFCANVSRARVIADLKRLAESARSVRSDLKLDQWLFLRHYCRTRQLRPCALRIVPPEPSNPS